ncbi:hypothetical protein GQR58_007539 [Nymphon striatum]|nr:hypothetical protein GQR58_007539 [Nymphon striatum]
MLDKEIAQFHLHFWERKRCLRLIQGRTHHIFLHFSHKEGHVPVLLLQGCVVLKSSQSGLQPSIEQPEQVQSKMLGHYTCHTGLIVCWLGNHPATLHNLKMFPILCYNNLVKIMQYFL